MLPICLIQGKELTCAQMHFRYLLIISIIAYCNSSWTISQVHAFTRKTYTHLIASPLKHNRLINLINRTLFTSPAGLENAKDLVTSYKQGKIQSMTPDLWSAKKVIDATLHPGMLRNIGKPEEHY